VNLAAAADKAGGRGPRPEWLPCRAPVVAAVAAWAEAHLAHRPARRRGPRRRETKRAGTTQGGGAGCRRQELAAFSETDKGRAWGQGKRGGGEAGGVAARWRAARRGAATWSCRVHVSTSLPVG
jgi:hypothetical protein